MKTGWSEDYEPQWNDCFPTSSLPQELAGDSIDEGPRQRVFESLDSELWRTSGFSQVWISGEIITKLEEPQYAVTWFLYDKESPSAWDLVQRMDRQSGMPLKEVDIVMFIWVAPSENAEWEKHELARERHSHFSTLLTDQGRLGCPIIDRGTK